VQAEGFAADALETVPRDGAAEPAGDAESETREGKRVRADVEDDRLVGGGAAETVGGVEVAPEDDALAPGETEPLHGKPLDRIEPQRALRTAKFRVKATAKASATEVTESTEDDNHRG